MEIIHSLDGFKALNSSVVTIGSYDGLHLGHREIIFALISKSKTLSVPSVLITFNPHPKFIVGSANEDILLITSMKEKIRKLKMLNLDYVYFLPFDEKVANTTAQDFLDNNLLFFNPIHFVIGYDHHLGKGRQGSPEFIKDYCRKKKINLKIIKAISYERLTVSSSNIRKLIKNGRVNTANKLLGSIFAISGKAVKGSGRGRDLSFPTANLKIDDEYQILPKNGVYLIRGKFIGLELFGMCNLGIRPTFNESKLIMEIHFFYDRLDNLYGEEIRVEFLDRVRDEIKFPTPKDLVLQLKKDKKYCLSIINKYN